MWMKTRVSHTLGIEYPIIQAGMAGASPLHSLLQPYPMLGESVRWERVI